MSSELQAQYYLFQTSDAAVGHQLVHSLPRSTESLVSLNGSSHAFKPKVSDGYSGMLHFGLIKARNRSTAQSPL